MSFDISLPVVLVSHLNSYSTSTTTCSGTPRTRQVVTSISSSIANVSQDEWRKFVSPTCPGPRSAHAVVGTPVGGGKLFLFGSASQLFSFFAADGNTGGEFSSLYQNSFHHYRDFWCFDIATHSWDRIDTKVRPAARSGHR